VGGFLPALERLDERPTIANRRKHFDHRHRDRAILRGSERLIAYIPEEPRTLVFADRSGSFRTVMEGRQNFHAPKFSPDGRR
jgi:hypothetical protein